MREGISIVRSTKNPKESRWRLGAVALVAWSGIGLFWGCAQSGSPPFVNPPDTREAIGLSKEAHVQARSVMLQHLESLEQVVDALGKEEFAQAQRLTESHLGFAMHREAMLRQKPEHFPSAYHDLAMAHHEAAEALARVISTKDYKVIMPKLDALLKSCVACHQAYRLQTAAER